MKRISILTVAAMAAVTLLLAGCSPGDGGKAAPPPGGSGGGGGDGGAGPVGDLPEIPMVRYEWSDDAADPSLSAEMGGKGFTGEGWETNLEFPAVGMPGAPKGGSMSMAIYDWPATLRLHGKDYNSSFNYMVADMCLESLLSIHPTTLKFVPNLATHWWISEDKSTYRFRINPEARWDDGSRITSADVIASYKLRMDEGCLFPSSILVYEKLEEPTAISPAIVEVKVKEENWRNFMYFAGMSIMPARDISIPGSEYLEKFQNAYTGMSGPYTVKTEDIEMGASLTITRRKDWWGLDNPAWDGLYNIDTYKVNVVTDVNLAFEKAKKGEIEYYPVSKASWWAEQLAPLDQVQRGLIVRRKFFTDAPIGTSGIAINMTKPVLSDVRIRKALQYLCNRELMIEKLFFNEYKPLSSYYQGGTYQNPDNELIEYDPAAAVELIEAAGWTDKNSELYRVKDGKVLAFNLMYRSKLSEPSLTIFQEDCKAAGIKIDLQLLTPAAHWKNLTEMEYELASTGWGALVFPNPETSYHSSLADKTGNNNVTGFKNPRVDELCKEYDREYDVDRRIAIIREIDGLVYNEHPYVLEWYNPAQRLIYWNKFGMPPWGGARTADTDSLHYCWWVDPELEKALEEAKQDQKGQLSVPEIENHFWEQWNASQRKR